MKRLQKHPSALPISPAGDRHDVHACALAPILKDSTLKAGVSFNIVR